MANDAGCNSVLVAIGSNLPGQKDSPIGQVSTAIESLADHNVSIVSQSRLFRTPCFPRGAGPDFVNAALACETDMTAEETLATLHRIEAVMGRQRQTRWGARVIDLDLIAHGNQVLPDLAWYRHWAGLSVSEQARIAPDGLILPHPRLQDRGFVLVPLMDVAPDWVHPVTGHSIRQMHAALDPAQRAEIWPVSG